MKGCLTAVVVILAILGGVFYFVWQATGALTEEADRFFGLIAANKLQDAFDGTSATFRKDTDLPKFQAFVAKVGLDGYQSASWSNRKIDNSQGRIEGKVTTKDGRTFGMQVDFQKDDGRWRVLGLRTVGDVPPPAGGAKGSEQPSPAAAPSPVAVASPTAAQPTAAQPAATPAPRTAAANKLYASNGEVPATDQLNAMVEDSLMSFNEAVQAKDFTAFHETLATPFKKKYTPDELAGVFRAFIEKGVDIGRVRGKEPSFTKEPKLEENDLGPMLAVEGEYPSEKVIFELEYLEQDGRWALAGINVRVK